MYLKQKYLSYIAQQGIMIHSLGSWTEGQKSWQSPSRQTAFPLPLLLIGRRKILTKELKTYSWSVSFHLLGLPPPFSLAQLTFLISTYNTEPLQVSGKIVRRIHST